MSVSPVNDLSFELYNFTATGTDQNIIISPYSIFMAVFMCYFGARGSTATQLASALSVSGLQSSQLVSLASQLANKNEQLGPKSILKSADGLFPNLKFPLLSSYKRDMANYFHSSLTPVDFSSPSSAAAEINKWIAKNTDHKIKNMIDAENINPDANLMIVNAVFFKAAWIQDNVFNSQNTQSGTFTTMNGEQVQVNMMSLDQHSFYYQTQPSGISGETLQLPYDGNTTAMTIILPFVNSSLSQLELELTAEKLDTIIKGSQAIWSVVDLELPKFEFLFKQSMASAFKALGAVDAFNDATADFSGMTTNSEGFYVGDILHQAYINLNEYGTEATASSAIEMVGMFVDPNKIEFSCNRSFMFVIHDTVVYDILFVGKFIGPSP